MEGGLPRFRPGFTCPALLRCQSCQFFFSPTGLSPCIAQLSRSILLEVPDLLTGPTTPEVKDFGLGSSRFARRYYGNLVLISFPLPTKMFQFGRSRFLNLCIQLRIMGYYSHWVAPFGYLRVKAFFQLTEAFRRYRVLHRLLMPRHPPAALNSLTKIVRRMRLSAFFVLYKL